MKKWIIWWPALVVFVAAVALGWAINSTFLFGLLPSFALSGVETEIRGNWGALGDAVGGLLNPLLTFISVVLLIHTIRISQKTLDQTKEALKISTEALNATKAQLEVNLAELECTRDEIRRASDAQEMIAETQKLQRIEASFYVAFEALSQAVSKLPTDQKAPTHVLDKMCKSSPNVSLNIYINTLLRTHAETGQVVRITITCLDLADGGPHLYGLVSALLNNEMRGILCLYACNVKNKDAGLLTEIIREANLFDEDVVVIPSSDVHGYLAEALRDLNVNVVQ